MRKFDKIEVGQIIGDMTVVREQRDVTNDRRMLLCRCNKCSREKLIYEGNLRDRPNCSSHAVACGFGLKKTTDPHFYDIWAHMKDRIYNPNNKYYYRYGGRGLTTDYDAYVDFCDAEYSKYIYAKTMFPKKRISLDRIDNDLGYVEGNLRWVGPTTQARNSTIVKEFIAQAPNGQLYYTNNQTAFGANHGLEPKHISDCLRGVQQTTGGGWRFWFPQINPIFVYHYENDPRYIIEMYY